MFFTESLRTALFKEYPKFTTHLNISDLVLSLTVGVDETIPYELFQRSSFWNSRRLLLIMWIVMANILSYAYKGTLLSTLVIIR